jgi:hypothetical protein
MELLHFDSDWARRQPAKTRAMELCILIETGQALTGENVCNGTFGFDGSLVKIF